MCAHAALKNDPRNSWGAKTCGVNCHPTWNLPLYIIKIRPELKTFSLYYHEPFQPKDTINLFILFWLDCIKCTHSTYLCVCVKYFILLNSGNNKPSGIWTCSWKNQNVTGIWFRSLSESNMQTDLLTGLNKSVKYVYPSYGLWLRWVFLDLFSLSLLFESSLLRLRYSILSPQLYSSSQTPGECTRFEWRIWKTSQDTFITFTE